MSENVSRLSTRISTLDGAAPDPYDHEISLVDTTDTTHHDEPRSESPTPSSQKLAKKTTNSSIKDRLARKKHSNYAKWQEGRYFPKADSTVTVQERDSTSAHPTEPGTGAVTETVDFAPGHSVDRGRLNAQKRGKESKHLKEQIHEYDVLYENQRGSFLCGIPLYSHSSLLPIDPAPWVNKDLHDSPVNITNAQVPDPSWEWAWKTWYVDMSYDVDEQGWQYSFAFGKNWSWHGTHPWFHSFVRRRRWLRKRVKRNSEARWGKTGGMGAAHHLTQDYFTIHSKRDRSPVSAVDGAGKTARPSSFISFPDTIGPEEPPEDVKDVGTLLKALRFATVDREKIDLVKKFVNQAGDELVYLNDHIPDIMSFFVFQNSRKQLLSFLKQTTDEARQHRQKHEEENKPEGDAESRRIDNLLTAVEAANAEIRGLEFWSDRKHVLQTSDNDSMATGPIAAIFDETAPRQEVEDDPVEEIKGIPAKADLRGETTSAAPNAEQQSSIENSDESEQKEDKGKGRADEYDNEDDRVETGSIPRLGPDDLLVPDQD
ncbi:hypothetical protein A1O3_05603 [Capronia epimyces CBS 606.96]|uniref:Peroxin/Ferlin domain-containing protein n=1 Tax=Capronia epimyces CBS 606.96 TaxID=1182542 RepID=W9XXI3_9EURO|nr:uncharacterized protein A1O3_05603 [Capronia epimyces CBS 606.96]EXJ84928.1 hypothetical protein A1O3_05603 [Capronia epimyces CBS 606.96]